MIMIIYDDHHHNTYLTFNCSNDWDIVEITIVNGFCKKKKTYNYIGGSTLYDYADQHNKPYLVGG